MAPPLPARGDGPHATVHPHPLEEGGAIAASGGRTEASAVIPCPFEAGGGRCDAFMGGERCVGRWANGEGRTQHQKSRPPPGVGLTPVVVSRCAVGVPGGDVPARSGYVGKLVGGRLGARRGAQHRKPTLTHQPSWVHMRAHAPPSKTHPCAPTTARTPVIPHRHAHMHPRHRPPTHPPTHPHTRNQIHPTHLCRRILV